MLLDTSLEVCSAVCILGQRFSLFVRCSLDPMTAVFATQFSNFAIIEQRGIIMYWQNGYSKVMGVKRFNFFLPFPSKYWYKIGYPQKHPVIANFIRYFE